MTSRAGPLLAQHNRGLSLGDASTLLLAGGVVAVPTETVYGLAASLARPLAIEELFRLKGRPAYNPLIVHAASIDAVQELVMEWPSTAAQLARHWPGPLTLILPANTERVPSIARAGLSSVAVRIPSHPLTLELLARTGPLVAPSANRSGRPSATSPLHVWEDFGEAFPVLDGGPCSSGVESTVLSLLEGRCACARLGALPLEILSQTLGQGIPYLQYEGEGRPISPGQLLRHYSPSARLSLYSASTPLQNNEVVIGLEGRCYGNAEVWPLGAPHDPGRAAYQLYALLRRLDAEGIQHAWVDLELPEGGLWSAIKERLTRAVAAQRPMRGS